MLAHTKYSQMRRLELHIDGWQHKGSFDEIEILTPGDSPSVFPSLNYMWNGNSLQKQRKMTLLKQFIKREWMCGYTKVLCPFHSSTKVLSPSTDLIPRLTLLLYDIDEEYL